MDTNINESCKEASHEGVRLKLVKLKEYTNGNFWVLFGRILFAKHNRYIALCMYCNKTLSGVRGVKIFSCAFSYVTTYFITYFTYAFHNACILLVDEKI